MTFETAGADEIMGEWSISRSRRRQGTRPGGILSESKDEEERQFREGCGKVGEGKHHDMQFGHGAGFMRNTQPTR